MSGAIMKSLYGTLLKLASLAILVVLGAAAAMAQDPRIQTSQLDALAAKAAQTVDVNLDERLMQFAAKFLSSKDPDENKVKELVNGLKGIYVKSFVFETEGQYTEADLEGIRSQLRNSAWNKIVNVHSKKEGSAEVYLMQVGNQISGLAVLASNPKEVTVVNIIGPVDLDKLTQLEGQFGIPDLEIERSKPKRKN
jgi:type II secretory pathway pseudopilin PulG